MARIRSIKPEFFLHEDMAELPALTRLLFIGLWTLADRRGRLEDRPKRIKAAILPYERADVDAMLGELDRAGFIHRYEADGIKCIAIPSFEKHQHCHVKEAESDLPVPPERRLTDEHRTSTVQAPEAADASRVGREGKGKEGNGDMSGCPPDVSAPKSRRQEAAEVLRFLNEKTNRAYQPTDANLDLILARFKEGYTVSQCRKVIARKTREWMGDERMAQYLRPATLFNREKFNQYVGELVVPNELHETVS